MLYSHPLVALCVATLLGMCIGLERSLAGKHAGMRTYALVSMGSCLFVIIGTLAALQLLEFFPSVNPLYVASNVVLGVGFLGTGLAIFRGEHPELTTAAGVWVAAGVGMACGFGFYLLAIVATVLVVFIFSVLAKLEYKISKHYGTRHEG